jgi:hypothetical protein
MKQLLFILLIFISFQGFSQNQTVKLNKIGLEVMKTDLGEMNWDEAKIACAKLKDDWRLPTKEEFFLIYKYKDRLGFKSAAYWSSTEFGNDSASAFFFLGGFASNNTKNTTYYVRAVRDLE